MHDALPIPYGAKHKVRYPEVCGRILADTKSTKSLFNTNFAKRRFFEVLTTETKIVLRKCKRWVEHPWRPLHLALDAYSRIG
jgi:hypothetical protein